MRERLNDLVKRLSAAADRRRAMDPPHLKTLDATLAVLAEEYGSRPIIDEADRPRRIAEVFRLDGTDLDLLVVAAAADLDANVGLAYGLLRGGTGLARPTVGLALELAGVPTLSPQAGGRLGRSGPLRHHGLLTVVGDQPWLDREVSCPDRVVDQLQGLDRPDPELAALLLEPVPLRVPGTQRLATALERGIGCCWIHGPRGTGGLGMAVGAVAEIGVPALTVQVPHGAAGAGLIDFLRSAMREAALTARCLVLHGGERLMDADDALALLVTPVVPVIVVSSREWDADRSPAADPLLFEAPRLDPQDRERLWRTLTGEAVPDGALTGLRLSPEMLTRTARYARLLAADPAQPLTVDLVREAVRTVGGSSTTLATGQPGFADLVLPVQIQADVHRLVGWARHREELVATGLVAGTGGSGGGITALFSGSPGTGKTLAAHVVAAELGMEIKRIDLSAIVDKYIGETQKNLERVFHQAESLNVVLFFDEADALFGRRSEVKDAHDRYANQEVAYLLQRMEQFDGITILATNLRGNLDPAFSRRLSFILHFPDPDVPTRLRLWQTHLARLGDQDPADPVDAGRLAAAVELTGGDIRNIVVAAGYDAAIENALPGMRHVLAATVGEYTKLGRRVPVGGFAGG